MGVDLARNTKGEEGMRREEEEEGGGLTLEATEQRGRAGGKRGKAAVPPSLKAQNKKQSKKTKTKS